MIAFLLAMSCSSPAEYADEAVATSPTPEDSGMAETGALVFDAHWLRRVSYDLRGIPPTPDELARLSDDPSAAAAITPPSPPVTRTKPCSASSRPASRAATVRGSAANSSGCLATRRSWW